MSRRKIVRLFSNPHAYNDVQSQGGSFSIRRRALGLLVCELCAPGLLPFPSQHFICSVTETGAWKSPRTVVELLNSVSSLLCVFVAVIHCLCVTSQGSGRREPFGLRSCVAVRLCGCAAAWLCGCALCSPLYLLTPYALKSTLPPIDVATPVSFSLFVL